MDRRNVTPIGAKKRRAWAGTREAISTRFVIQDGEQGWLITAAHTGPEMRDLVAMAIENHRRVSDLLGAISTAAGLASGHPFVMLEALPLTEEQMADLKKAGNVTIWQA